MVKAATAEKNLIRARDLARWEAAFRKQHCRPVFGVGARDDGELYLVVTAGITLPQLLQCLERAAESIRGQGRQPEPLPGQMPLPFGQAAEETASDA